MNFKHLKTFIVLCILLHTSHSNAVTLTQTQKRVAAGVVAVAAALGPIIAIRRFGPHTMYNATIWGKHFVDANGHRWQPTLRSRLGFSGYSLLSIVSAAYAARPQLFTRR